MEASVLVVDDSQSARLHIINILKQISPLKSFHEAGGATAGFKLLLNRPVDIVICDLEMPGMDGFKFLNLVSTREEIRKIPVIMVTGREDQETKIKGLEFGASDYVTKPFDPDELVARVKVQLKIKSLQDSLKKNNELLLNLSNTDPLTQLFNRRYLTEALDNELMRSARVSSPLALLMLDIDHFKRVNDTYGHQGGDRVLVAMAELLRGHLRPYDVAARFGGEEFALILPGTGLPQALEVAGRLREAAERLSFSGNLQDLKLTVSLGAAAFPFANVKTVDDLIREADYALYGAKRGGRNRVEAMSV